MAYPVSAGGGVAPVSQNPTQGAQWPSDPQGMLEYYRDLLQQLAEMEQQITSATGGTKLTWENGQIKGQAKMDPATRDRLSQMQIQMAKLREEKTSLERVLPGIMRMRQGTSAQVQQGMSPIAALAGEQQGMQRLGQQMGAAPMMAAQQQQAAMPFERQMIEQQYGPISDQDWTAYRSQALGLPSGMAGMVNPLDERAMALREQQFGYEQQQNTQAQQMQRQQYADAIKQQLFENTMGQQRLQAQIAGDVAGMRSQQWAQGMPWVVPGGTQFTPGWEPGGLAQQVGQQMGLNVPAYRVAPWQAPDPAAVYAQYMQQMQQQPSFVAPQSQHQAMLPLIMGGR